MLNLWDLLDRVLRRNPYLPRLKFLRTTLRRPYHALLNFGGGLPLQVGGVFPVQVPAKYLIKEQANYEVEACEALRSWIDKNPNSTIVDIGCSYGFITCAALFQKNVRHVYAIDADRESLFITQKVCQYAPQVSSRLSLWNCLISKETGNLHGVDDIRNLTNRILSSKKLTGDSRFVQYVNADSKVSEQELPRIKLDDLLTARKESSNPILVKCDVEGAELMVLQGSEELFDTLRPTWLLSVHPNLLSHYSATIEEIRSFLNSKSYTIELLSTDHEEHWLCSPTGS